LLCNLGLRLRWLRLLHEDEHTYARSSLEYYVRSLHELAFETYETQSLVAHASFYNQLNNLQNRGRFDFEIIEEHHLLFNGVFMRVPANMVETIATLPEVFVVTPKEEDVHDPIIIYPDEYISYIPETADPFMLASRVLFETYYIHNHLQLPGSNGLGITGANKRCSWRDPCGGCGEHVRPVRVAVLDDPINSNHPRFQDYLYPATGRLRGNQRTISMSLNHGTVVAGPVIAIAPGIELWCLPPTVAGITLAWQAGVDVMNRSFSLSSPFSPTKNAMNIATLDGIVTVNSGGNAGPGWRTVTGRTGLFIAVGSGEGGSDRASINNRDGIASHSSRGPAQFIFHIKPDIVAPGSNVRTPQS